MAVPNRATQQRIDNQIACLERDLIELKRQRNALSPISTIPPELLCEILFKATTHYTSPTLDNPEGFPDRLRNEGFISVLCHVSHTWRELTLGCPELWTEIDVGITTDALRIEFAAKHAHTLPISLCIKGANSISMNPRMGEPKAIEAVKGILSRTSAFDKLSLLGDLNLLSNLLQVARPERLQALQISVRSYRASESEYAAAGAAFARHPLVVNGTSGLHTLTLMGCTIPMTSNLFLKSPNLTTLLASIHRDASILSLLDALREMPRLERLQLGLIYPFQPSQGTLTPVVLPHLRGLTLQGESLPLTTALSYLRLPMMEIRMTFGPKLSDHEDLRQTGIDLFRALGEARESPENIRAKLPSDRTFAPHALIFRTLPSIIAGCGAMLMTHWAQGPQAAGGGPGLTAVRVRMDNQTRSNVHWKEWHPFHLARHPGDLRRSIGWALDELNLCGAFDDGDSDNGSLWQLLSKCPKVSQVNVDPGQALKLLPLLHSNEGSFPFPSLNKIVMDAGNSTSFVQDYDSLLEATIGALSKRQLLSHKYSVSRSWVLEGLLFEASFPSPPNERFVHDAQAQRLIRHVEWKGRRLGARFL